MNKRTDKHYDDVLDAQTLQLLGEATAGIDTVPEQMQGLRDQVMRRIDDAIARTSRSFFTVRNHAGAWIEFAPGIKKKVLAINPETGAESCLLRAEPGAEAPAHIHELDEHCLVLEGEMVFDGGTHLKEGDYHFAPAGSRHGTIHTDVGVLVYIQTGVPGFQPSL